MMELIRPVLTRASNPLKRASPRALSQRFAARPRPLHQLAASRFRSQLRSSSAPSPAVAAYKQLLYRPFQRLNSTTSEAQPQLLSESSDSQPLTETSESQTLTETSESQANSEQAEVRSDVPAYELTFTCKPCTTRTTHRISKQGYHHGTVLITCPNCKSRHLITDHLKVFKDYRMTIEDILAEKGDLVKKGTLGEQGNIEFWDDGTVTKRHEKAERRWEGKTEEKALEAPV